MRELETRTDASIAELVAITGLHENTVRGHLTQLQTDGYIRREREDAHGRGRPAWRWQAVGPERLNAYAGLAATLAAALDEAAPDAVSVARRAGAAWGANLAAQRAESSDTDDARALVIDVMREQGFSPAQDGTAIRLRACPLLAAAARSTDVVCAVHEGMIQGIAGSRDPRLKGRLVPFADAGACVLHLGATA